MTTHQRRTGIVAGCNIVAVGPYITKGQESACLVSFCNHFFSEQMPIFKRQQTRMAPFGHQNTII